MEGVEKLLVPLTEIKQGRELDLKILWQCPTLSIISASWQFVFSLNNLRVSSLM
jgi:hypothetical protein